MRTLTRRSAIVSVSAFALAPRAARPAGNDTVRFGLLHPNLTTVIHEIAKRTGAYNQQNLTVVETRFKSGQTVEGVEQLWRANLDFYMGGAPEIPRLNSRIIEGGGAPPLAVVSGANPGHTSLVLGNKLNPKSIDEILKQLGDDPGARGAVVAPECVRHIVAEFPISSSIRRAPRKSLSQNLCVGDGFGGGAIMVAIVYRITHFWVGDWQTVTPASALPPVNRRRAC
jgi:hypothetical protein